MIQRTKPNGSGKALASCRSLFVCSGNKSKATREMKKKEAKPAEMSKVRKMAQSSAMFACFQLLLVYAYHRPTQRVSVQIDVDGAPKKDMDVTLGNVNLNREKKDKSSGARPLVLATRKEQKK